MADAVVFNPTLGRATRYKYKRDSRLGYLFHISTLCRGSALFSSITIASNALARLVNTFARTEDPCAPTNWAKTATIWTDERRLGDHLRFGQVKPGLLIHISIS
jgi:hypothetical protein